MKKKYDLLMKDFWEALRRNPIYKRDVEGFRAEIKIDPVSALKKFNEKWSISVCDPSLTFEQLLHQWESGIKSGYKPRPFPMEIIYYNGEKNFPLFFSPASRTFTINRKALKKKKKDRKRELLINPWMVYDVHKESGMPLLEIMRVVFNITARGKKGLPSYNARVFATAV